MNEWLYWVLGALVVLSLFMFEAFRTPSTRTAILYGTLGAIVAWTMAVPVPALLLVAA